MAAVLELRPGCELCDRELPADSIEAVICTTAKHGALLARYRGVPPEQR